MRVSDVMSGANLAIYPEIALVIFLAVFAAVTARLIRRRRDPQWSRYAGLPLLDDAAAPASQPATHARDRSDQP